MSDYRQNTQARRLFLGTCTGLAAGMMLPQKRTYARQVTVNQFRPCIEFESWYSGLISSNLGNQPDVPDAQRIEELNNLVRKREVLSLSSQINAAGLSDQIPVSTERALQSLGGSAEQPQEVSESMVRELRGIAEVDLLWDQSNVSVQFLNNDNPAVGSTSFRELFEIAFEEWEKHTGLTFTVTPNRGDIRVAFGERFGHYSFVGTASINGGITKQNRRESMNIDPTGVGSPRSRDFTFGTILHEIGHAVGLHHEHQNPDGGIEWDYQKLVSYFGNPAFYNPPWSEELIIHNIFRKLTGDVQYTRTRRDPDSIMHYPFPDEVVPDGLRNQIPRTINTELSSTDISFTRGLYNVSGDPDPDPLTNEPTVRMDETPLTPTLITSSAQRNAEIQKKRERLGFQFQLAGTNHVTIYTKKTAEHERLPMIVELHRSDDFDDDSRIGLASTPGGGESLHDAYLVTNEQLASGTYYILAYAAYHQATGHFAIGWNVGDASANRTGFQLQVQKIQDLQDITKTKLQPIQDEIKSIQKLQKGLWIK